MTVIGRQFVPELGREIDVFDHPDSVPDEYIGDNVAVPQDSIRPDQLAVGGVAVIRQAGPGTIIALRERHWTLTPGADYYGRALPDEPGISFLMIPVVMALIKLIAIIIIAIVCVVLAFKMTEYANHVEEYKDPQTGETCKYITVQTGMFSTATLDTCNNEWTAPPRNAEAGVFDDLVKYGTMAIAVVAGAYIVFKVVLPELSRTRATNNK
jgi:hypothetical protein